MDQPTDQWTNRTSYPDARTHLKKWKDKKMELQQPKSLAEIDRKKMNENETMRDKTR